MLKLDIDREIQSITQQLIDKYKPEKIVLFGSGLGNKFNPEKSDLDFLIIKKNVPFLGRKRIYQLDRLINYRIASDFIVYTPDEIKKLLDLKDPFLESIIKEGKILYEQKSTP